MKKILITSLTLLLLTGCGNIATYENKNQINQEELSAELSQTSYEEAVVYLMENDIDYVYRTSSSDSIPEGNIISVEVKEDKAYVVVSTGPKELYVPSYLGSERGLVEQWAEELKQNYSIYDYDFVFEEDCETNYNCVVRDQSIVHQLIKTDTTVVYTFSQYGPYECKHNYIKTVIEPTCTKDGSIIYECSLCGDRYSEPGEKAHGHSFADNKQYCLYGCGAKNPSYVPPAVVEKPSEPVSENNASNAVVEEKVNVTQEWLNDLNNYSIGIVNEHNSVISVCDKVGEKFYNVSCGLGNAGEDEIDGTLEINLQPGETYDKSYRVIVKIKTRPIVIEINPKNYN